MTGRRPKRSDKTPRTGEKTNCMIAKTNANQPLHHAVPVISPPRKSKISFGKTGMINPIARMSSVTVTRIKVIVALLAFTRKLIIGGTRSVASHYFSIPMWERPQRRDIAGPARTRDAEVPPTLMPVRMQRGSNAQKNLKAVANPIAVVAIESVGPDVQRELSAESDVD